MDFWLEKALNEIDAATDGISPANMSLSPAEGKWSVAQILGHLSLTFRTTLGALAKVLQSGDPSATKGTFKQWISTRVVADLGYFPTGRAAPIFSLPNNNVSASQITREIRENLLAMDAILDEVEAKLGPAVKIADHPVLGPFTVQEWRKFHYRHTHHHVKQVRALKRRFSRGAQGAAAN
jgi:DinB family protein